MTPPERYILGMSTPAKVIVMRSVFSRSLHAVGASAAVLAVAALLAPTPAQAYGGHSGGGHYGGGHYGGGHYGGWGWGLGLGLGVGLAAEGLWGWPGYYGYPYGAYPYAYYPVAPTTTVIEQVPVAAPAAAAYYYCDSPKGYYPYVASCQTPWRPVPAAPPAQ
jgi:hypothetical protein